VDIAIRTISPEEFEAHVQVITAAFGGTARSEDIERERIVAEVDRSLAAFDGAEIVGGASAASFTLTVPGGFVRAAGVTGVGVKPTHRRQGINTALMRRQLDDIHAIGEQVAILYASEGGIYGRYGYGAGSFRYRMETEPAQTAYVRGYRAQGRTRLLPREDALSSFLPLYDAVRRERPGGIELDATWFGYRFSESHWAGDRRWFYAAHEGVDGLDAYAVYRIQHGDHGPQGMQLQVEEVQATSPQGYGDIWRFLFDMDLVGRVTAWSRPVDEPLLHLVREFDALNLTLRDGLWVRLVDVPAALAARRYTAQGRVTFEVRDLFCPWNEGRYVLEVGPDGASCERTDAEPELVMSVNELGAAYLGGVSFRQLHRAGRVVEERPPALALADAMFGWDPAPWCSFVF
jgi:predicted acetyltransferase